MLQPQILGSQICKESDPSTSPLFNLSVTKVSFFFLTLTRIFKFRCFSGYYAHIFDKNKFYFPMQTLILNRFASIWNLKNQK